MLRNHKKLARLLTASLAIAALAPATAGAVPAIDGNTGIQATQGQSVAAGGGPGVTPQTLTAPKQDLRAPDQVDGTVVPQQDLRTPDQVDGPFAPQQDLRAPDQVSGPQAAPKSSDDGLGTDTIVLIIIGGVALVAAAGLGLAKARTARQRQLA
jgi:hypothetical protein